MFLEEERERELEQVFDRVNNRDEGGTARILDRKRSGADDGDEVDGQRDDEPQSEAVVRKSMLNSCKRTLISIQCHEYNKSEIIIDSALLISTYLFHPLSSHC